MGKGWLGAAACLAITVAAAADVWGEPLRFRWPLPAEAVVTQATIDHFGNFAHEYRIRASRPAGGGAIRVSTSGYRLLYHNRRLLTGRKLDGFDMLGILHRLTVPSYVIDGAGRLQRIEPPDPNEIETAFLENVGSPRVASLRRWYVAQRPGDFQQIRQRSQEYWHAQIPYWEYWIGKWRALVGPVPMDLQERHLLHLAGLQVPGRTYLIDRSKAPDCAACISVAAEDRFSRDDLAPYSNAVADRLGLTRAPGEAAMTGMRAFVRLEAIIDWRTMLPYRVQAMTIAFQYLADGSTVNFDQTKHFYFEWQHGAAGPGAK